MCDIWHTSLLGIKRWTSCQQFPIPLIWCGIISVHWSIKDWILHFGYLAINVVFSFQSFCSTFSLSHICHLEEWKVSCKMSTMVYHATSQRSTFHIVMNFCFFIPSLQCNLLGTSKIYDFLFVKKGSKAHVGGLMSWFRGPQII
jgi:hypothetical protein